MTPVTVFWLLVCFYFWHVCKASFIYSVKSLNCNLSKTVVCEDGACQPCCNTSALLCILYLTLTNTVHGLLLLLHPFNGPFSGTTRVSRYQKGKTNLDFTKARDSEWQWHQLDHMQVCTSLQTDNHASTPPLSCLQAGCPSCHSTNSVKALKATVNETKY